MGNIARARAGYKPPTGTVQIVLDVELAKERKLLLDRIDEARAEAQGRLVTPKLKKLNAELETLTEREREHVHKLRMTKLPGVEWGDLADKYPPRMDVQFDLDLGYNHHAVALVAARISTVEIVDAGEDEAKEVPLDDEDWDTILEIASGWDISNIVNLQINLNVLQASNRLGRLKKD
jgi:hypothetical protein